MSNTNPPNPPTMQAIRKDYEHAVMADKQTHDWYKWKCYEESEFKTSPLLESVLGTLGILRQSTEKFGYVDEKMKLSCFICLVELRKLTDYDLVVDACILDKFISSQLEDIGLEEEFIKHTDQ